MSTQIPLPIRVTVPNSRPGLQQPANRAFEIVRTLLEWGYSVGCNGTPAAINGEISVVFRSAKGNDAIVVDASDGSPSEVADRVDQLVRPDGQAEPRWKPWFPAVDANRCTNCMQCLSFCLFDVYGVTPAGKIVVANPSNCKTDCPACSRVCPEVAIMFPKYRTGPINGEEVSPEDLRRETMKIDISSLLGGDVYSLLRDRTERAKSRFSKERDEDRALKERQRCLAKLQEELQELDIPPEAMAALPSPERIREKAEAARQKAQAALALQAENDEL